MTAEQRNHRRLARKYGRRAAVAASAGQGIVYEPFTIRDIATVAKQAATHAFEAHPELRPEWGFNNAANNLLKMIPYAVENGHPWDYKGAHMHVQCQRLAVYVAGLAFELHPELRER